MDDRANTIFPLNETMSIITKITQFFMRNPQDSEKEGRLNALAYTGKFVKQNNTDIGESIAVDGRRIIVKNPESTISIPVEAVLRNSENIAVCDFDREEAIRLGNEWAQKKDVLKFDDKGMMVR